MVEPFLNKIFCVPNGTQNNPRDKKRAPLSRGLEEESLPGTIPRQEGGFLLYFFGQT